MQRGIKNAVQNVVATPILPSTHATPKKNISIFTFSALFRIISFQFSFELLINYKVFMKKKKNPFKREEKKC